MLLADVPAVFLSPLTFAFLTVTLEKQCIIFEGHLLSQIQSSMYMNKKPIFFHSLCLSVQHSSLTTRYKRNVLEHDSFLHGLTSAAYHIRTKKNCSSHPNKRSIVPVSPVPEKNYKERAYFSSNLTSFVDTRMPQYFREYL